MLDVETRHEARIETRRIIKSVSNDAGPENPTSLNLWLQKISKLHAIFFIFKALVTREEEKDARKGKDGIPQPSIKSQAGI